MGNRRQFNLEKNNVGILHFFFLKQQHRSYLASSDCIFLTGTPMFSHVVIMNPSIDN